MGVFNFSFNKYRHIDKFIILLHIFEGDLNAKETQKKPK